MLLNTEQNRTSQIKYIVKASVTRRSAYDTGGIATLDGDTQDVGTETEWIAARQRRQQCGDQCLGKMSLPLLPEPIMSPLQVEQNSTDRTMLCISLVCGPRHQRLDFKYETQTHLRFILSKQYAYWAYFCHCLNC